MAARRSEMFSVIRCGLLLIAVVSTLLGALGCATSRAVGTTSSAFEAGGIFMCNIRVRLAPSHTQAFEKLLKRCVTAAQSAESRGVSHHWLCYREPPGRYWLIFFSDTIDGFQTPCAFPGFALAVARTESVEAEREVKRMLHDLEFEVEWEHVSRQKADWSTVNDMSTTTHPVARVMLRTVRPGMEKAFEHALAARTAFLARQGYPLPIEGFATRSGLVGREMQAVFGVDWSSFHATDSFHAFVQSLDEAAREEYAGLKATLMQTMSGAEYYDGTFAPELRFPAP